MKTFFADLLETLAFTFVVIFLIYKFIAIPELVLQSSMFPTIFSGERVLVDKLSTHLYPYERGEIIVLNPPNNQSTDYIKRIVGLPGDILKIYDCKVYISRGGNRYIVEETYITEDTCTNGGNYLKEGRSLRLEEDEYVVMGDNRSNSTDSRSFGPVKRNAIVGRVIYRFWPISRAGFM